MGSTPRCWSLLIVGVIALVEAVSYRHSYRVDLTENKRWSLSPQTIKVVRELPVPVKAVAFFRPDQPGKRAAEDLLRQYATRSDGKFTWEVVDADRNPLAAKQYNVESYGTVVLEAALKGGETKQEKIQDLEEEKLTNALIRATRPGKRTVYFLKGHGEKDPSSGEPHRLQPDEVGAREAELRGEGRPPRARDEGARRRGHRGRGRAAEGPLAERDRRAGGLRGPGRQGALPGRSVPGRRARPGARAVGARPRATT